MSELPKNESDLLPSTRTTVERQQVAREIESKAGVGLKREYWLDMVDTPLGSLSRRAAALTIVGVLFWCVVLAAAALWRISTAPAPVVLPFGDARTVMTHVYANFSGNKDPQFEPFIPREGDIWYFQDGYTFQWRDSNGVQQRVLILSYDNLQALNIDYGNYTRSINTSRQPQAISLGVDVVVESRSKPEYGSMWQGITVSNLLMLISPTVTEPDKQELYSHLISIAAAEHRDFIPTATP